MKKISILSILSLLTISCGENTAELKEELASSPIVEKVGFSAGEGQVYYDGLGGGDDHGTDVVMDGQGRIVVAGYIFNGSDDDMAVWRFNADGSLDKTFGDDGIATHHGAAGGDGYDQGHGVAIDSAGNIIIVGESSAGAFDMDMAVWRYTSSGVLDTTFAGTGFMTHHNAAGGLGNDFGSDVAVDSSDNIIVVGRSESANATYSDMAVWKYTSGGLLDTSFSGDGVFSQNFGSGGGNESDEASAIEFDSTGKIVVVGNGYITGGRDMMVWRFNTNGTLDTSFGGGDGQIIHGAGGSGHSAGLDLSINSSDEYFITGYDWPSMGTKDLALWKVDSGGSVSYFSHNNAAGGNANDLGHGIAIDSTGDVVIVGSSDGASSTEFAVWKFDQSGNLQTSFGDGNGYISINQGSNYDIGKSLVCDFSDNIISVGASSSGADTDMSIWRVE